MYIINIFYFLSILFSINNDDKIIVLEFKILSNLNFNKAYEYKINSNSFGEGNLIYIYNTSSFINDYYIFQILSTVKIESF